MLGLDPGILTATEIQGIRYKPEYGGSGYHVNDLTLSEKK